MLPELHQGVHDTSLTLSGDVFYISMCRPTFKRPRNLFLTWKLPWCWIKTVAICKTILLCSWGIQCEPTLILFSVWIFWIGFKCGIAFFFYSSFQALFYYTWKKVFYEWFLQCCIPSALLAFLFFFMSLTTYSAYFKLQMSVTCNKSRTFYKHFIQINI